MVASGLRKAKNTNNIVAICDFGGVDGTRIFISVIIWLPGIRN